MLRFGFQAKNRAHSFLRRAYNFIRTHKMLAAAVILITLLFVTFTKTVVTLLILLLMAIPSTFITMYKRVVRLPPALELISLTATMATVFYGPVVGIIYTIIVNFASEVASGHPDEMTLTYVPSRIVQVLFVHFAYAYFGLTGIVALGIWGNVAFNAVQQPIFMALVDIEKRLKAIYFVMLNIPLNILIFKVLGPPLYALLNAIIR